MKNKLLLAGTLTSVFFANVTSSSAQDQAGTFLRSGVGDGNKLINAYMSPIMKGFGQGLNDGWYNTAKPLGLGGIDIRVNFGLGFVPSSDQTYNFNSIGLNTDPSKPRLVLPAGTNPELPTLFGDKQDNPAVAEVRSTISHPTLGTIDTTIASFKMPTGTGINMTPSIPMAQLSVGLVKNTEVTLRFFPKTTVGDFKAGMFGFGVKHDIKQWIPGIKEQKWDWSVYFGYTSMSSEYVAGKLLTVDTSAYNPDPTIAYDNQKISFNASAFTVGTMVSKKLLFFTPYVALNYAYSKVNMKFEGDYPITAPNDQISITNQKVTKIERVTDPIDIEGKLSNFRAAAGFRIKLTLITLSGEYSFGKYNTATLGVGLNLQSIKPFKL